MAWGVLSLPDRPDELSVYATEAYYTGPDSRLRRFTYRVDGFVSLRAKSEATLSTKPVIFEGSELEVNFETSEGGMLRVELQDTSGQPLKGFALDACTPAIGDTTQHTVRWNHETDLRSLEGIPIRIKFQLSGGDLYSFRFKNRE